MYGLVNKAIKGLIESQFGAETWREIALRAKLPQCPFLSMRSYPDQLTYELVSATSEVLKLSAAEVLEVFGEHWILFTAKEGYGGLLEHCGQDLREFLLNIDMLHTRVGLIFPELQPPGFKTFEQPDGSIRLEYYSTRAGLTPMVSGLLKGLAKRFGTSAQIEQIAADNSSEYQAAFNIRWQR
jgi:hypothetical protein